MMSDDGAVQASPPSLDQGRSAKKRVATSPLLRHHGVGQVSFVTGPFDVEIVGMQSLLFVLSFSFAGVPFWLHQGGRLCRH